MIECVDVTVRVASNTLLRRVSLRVEGGEVVAIIGPNGAGKSTLFHVLAGDRLPESGEVRVLGKRLDAWALEDLAKVRAALPQDTSLSFPFSVLEVVLIGRSPHVRSSESAEDFRVARWALGRVGLGRFESRIYTTLSGGEQQRTQLARVLAQLADGQSAPGGARVLLLDEPTSSLDPRHQHTTLRIARELARTGASVLVVLHDLNLAAQYADRVALLASGEIVAAGRPDVVLTEDRLERVFGVPMRVFTPDWAPLRRFIAVAEPSVLGADSPSPS